MQPTQHTPFISPLEPKPVEPTAMNSAHIRLNILVIILMVIFLSGLGILAYQATISPTKQQTGQADPAANSSSQAAKETNN